MALYHFSAKVISRGAGRSAVAAAAYRAGEAIHDQRLDRVQDYTDKAGVVHSEILLPPEAPKELADRATLWNRVEAGEKRGDAQLAREVEVALPRELPKASGIELVRDFVVRQFVALGMIADLNVHHDRGPSGELKPHAHVMLTMRSVGPEGFGLKVREWNAQSLLVGWREAWAAAVNAKLAELGIEATVDHRSNADRGIALEPQHKIGPVGMRHGVVREGLERVEDHRRIARENGEKILAKPEIALDALTRDRASFTQADLARFVHRHSHGKEQFDRVLAAVRASPELERIGRDGRGEERFTSREMLRVEERMRIAADRLSERAGHRVTPAQAQAVREGAAGTGFALSAQQKAALGHVLGGPDLVALAGSAGSGKSALLGVARAAWEQAGYSVRGAALAGIAAEGLESGSGIPSSTVAALQHRWERGEAQLGARDVLVVDEAGLLGSRQMQALIAAANGAKAKLVLVGDAEQLQAIEAGAPFRWLVAAHGAHELTEVWRQREDWQRAATRAFAAGRPGEALAAYAGRGALHASPTRDGAAVALVDAWDRARVAEPGKSLLMLAHTRADVTALNEMARARLRATGDLPPASADVEVATDRGVRAFAPGDRVMFLQNRREVGVVNGMGGTVLEVSAERMRVQLADGRALPVNLRGYAHIDHGYATTIHKSQGVTVDRTFVLASPGLDRHAAYVAMTRHRETAELFWGRDDFQDRDALFARLSRARAKDMALDWFEERQKGGAGVSAPSPSQTRADAALERARVLFAGMRELLQAAARGLAFEGLRLPAGPDRSGDVERDRAIELHALRHSELARAGARPLPHQLEAARAAAERVAALGPHALSDLTRASARNPDAVAAAAQGDVRALRAAMAHEAKLRSDPALRAQEFVRDWKDAVRSRAEAAARSDWDGRERHNIAMVYLSERLAGDPDMATALHGHRKALGLPREPALPGLSLELGKQIHDIPAMGAPLAPEPSAMPARPRAPAREPVPVRERQIERDLDFGIDM